MKNVNILFVIIIGLCLSLSYGCKKKSTSTNYPGPSPEVTTLNVTNITSTSATCYGYVLMREGQIQARGIRYSRGETPCTNGYVSEYANLYQDGDIQRDLTGLTPKTTYYFVAFASYINYQGVYLVVCGTVKSFTTL